MASGASPLLPAGRSSESCKPSGNMGGISFPAARAFDSAHCLNRTRLRMRASPGPPALRSIASLTRLATLRRRDGSKSSLSSFCNVSVAGRKMSRDMASSRSLRKVGLVAARGASCDCAKLRAGAMSAVGEEVHIRISSMSCSRSSAKCKAGSVSSICLAC